MVEGIAGTVIRLTLIGGPSRAVARFSCHIICVYLGEWHTTRTSVLRVTSIYLRGLSQHLVTLRCDRIAVGWATLAAER